MLSSSFFQPLPLSLAFLLCILQSTSAAPQLAIPSGQSMTLHRRAPQPRTTEEWGQWARKQRQMLATKYGSSQPQKRSSGTNLITNQNADSSFFGSLAVGTPPVSYNVILDTGSADLWIASSTCSTGCQNIPTFAGASSSTFSDQNTSFSIQYGSGRATGALAQDIVQMAGFSVSNQTFGLCDVISDGLLTNPVSGLLGLAFRQIASSSATPFWQTLVEGGAWNEPVMAFQLSRYLDDLSTQALEPGGSFSMGSLDSSLYTGTVEYINMPTSTPSYWILPLTSLTAQGNSVALPTGSESYSAIDTGTTLVGGPSQYVGALFAQIPGSRPGTGNFQGYYTYPCTTSVNVTLSFGGRNWPINPADFRLTQLSDTTCVGAFFDLNTGSSAPAWIIGDTFLKNVYSVFRYSPASIGFAQLSSTALALNGANGPVPSATIGSVAATVAATGRTSSATSGAMGQWTMPSVFVFTMIMGMTIMILCL